jgi:hypothetical protein
MRCSPRSARVSDGRQSAVYRRLRSAGRGAALYEPAHLLDSDIHLASFDDHYLYDSLSLRIDTVQQDNASWPGTATI